ncbi:MAG TPA: RAMP superfamily CRISPR-associated protein [Anaerolineae bacterium]|nr:RAMP superfamily CRISPR-associated protein [Anaerolineae bacterium]
MHLTLKSDATFGRGDGVAGLVDEEVQHDRYGLPYLSGRTLKGLLASECADILFGLKQSMPAALQRWEAAARFLFGAAGSGDDDAAHMRVGDARLPRDLSLAIAEDFRPLENLKREERERQWGLKQTETLEALTALRRQTALDATGAPLKDTLRTMRVIIRETPFEARLTFVSDIQDDGDELALLAACVKALRRAGTGRHRGRGRIEAELRALNGQDITQTHFKRFAQVVNP